MGLWASASDNLGARAVRGMVEQAGRGVLPSPHTPLPADWRDDQLTAAWLGHSTVLINFQGLNIITDPVLGRRVGAETLLGTIGAKRFIAPALRLDQLPPIDLVILSHAHMDHFDTATLRRLPGSPQVVTARATADLLEKTGLHRHYSLGWGEAACVKSLAGDIQVEAFEVRHWGARWRYDRQRGYNGYILSRGGQRVIFGGDTAYTDTFAALRGKGPYDLAIMPIGAYNPWTCSHCTPEEAVRMADAAGADRLLPIHFKTFPLGREDRGEPIERLHAALRTDRIGWSDVGQTFVA